MKHLKRMMLLARRLCNKAKRRLCKPKARTKRLVSPETRAKISAALKARHAHRKAFLEKRAREYRDFKRPEAGIPETREAQEGLNQAYGRSAEMARTIRPAGPLSKTLIPQ